MKTLDLEPISILMNEDYVGKIVEKVSKSHHRFYIEFTDGTSIEILPDRAYEDSGDNYPVLFIAVDESYKW